MVGRLQLDPFHLEGGGDLPSLEQTCSGYGYAFAVHVTSAGSTVCGLTEHLPCRHGISYSVASDQSFPSRHFFQSIGNEQWAPGHGINWFYPTLHHLEAAGENLKAYY